MALYNPCDLSDAQYCLNQLDNTLLLTYIITGEYVAHYISSLFLKVILLPNIILGVNLVVANAMLLCYATHYISNVLLLTVK